MDPVTAFGLLVNIATLIDLGVKVIGIYKDGLGPNQTRLVESADEIDGLCQQLQSTKIVNQPTASGSVEADLQDCVKRCIEKTTALRKRLDLPTKLGSKRQRALESVRLRFSRTIPQLERELQDLRVELDTKLLVSIRENISLNAFKQTKRFKSLDSSIQNVFVRFCDSQSTALDLVLDRSTRKILDCMDEIQKTHVENQARRDFEQRKSKILESLINGNPFTRENDILSKHDGTFEWIFDEGPETGSTFLRWLRSPANGGIYWIQGKPGSGKSTLMKFLCTSTDRIEQSLHLSATAKTPVFFSFYFWLADAAMWQNTEKGLLCSLLYQYLETSWILDSSYLTDARLRQKRTQGNWDLVELRSLVFLAADAMLNDHYVCLFVDALDECHAGDFVRVVDLIKKLSNRGVRVCVSSRPEQRIINKLEPDATEILKVDLYTKNDIANFVYDELGAVDLSAGSLTQSDLDHLAHQIIENADGVFLWATLVARDLCKGIENGDNSCQLRHRTNQTPGDLDALYKNMLSRLGTDQDVYIAEAASYFSLVLHDESNVPYTFMSNGGLPLVYCLSAYKRFQGSVTTEEEDNLDVLLPRVENRINVVCAGMLISEFRWETLPRVLPLEGSSSSLYSSLNSSLLAKMVRFVHRTARDFYLESSNDIMRSSSLTLFDFFSSATAGFMKAWIFYGPLEDGITLFIDAIEELAKSRLTPEEKVRLLSYIDTSMQEKFQTKHWPYRYLLTDGNGLGDLPPLKMDYLDLLGIALSDTSDPQLLDSILENSPSLCQRYKSYLLLIACNSPICSSGIRKLLSIGADPNQTMFSTRTQPIHPFRTKTSPWTLYLTTTFPKRAINWGLIELFLKNGASLEEVTLWRADLANTCTYLDSHWCPKPRLGWRSLLLQANVRYVLEAKIGSSLQSWSATELPAAYCKVLGTMNTIYSRVDLEVSERSYIEWDYDTELYLFGDDIITHTEPSLSVDRSATPASESALQRLVRDIQRSFPKAVHDVRSLHEIVEYKKRAHPVACKTWGLRNGYLTNDPEPAALFPGYERFRGADGRVDIDALFAGELG